MWCVCVLMCVCVYVSVCVCVEMLVSSAYVCEGGIITCVSGKTNY